MRDRGIETGGNNMRKKQKGIETGNWALRYSM